MLLGHKATNQPTTTAQRSAHSGNSLTYCGCNHFDQSSIMVVLEDDIVPLSVGMGVILDLQSRAQTGHWKFAVDAWTEAAKWRRSLADYAWWRRSSSSADCISVRQRCLSRAVATSSVGGMPHHFTLILFT